mmetsp:Transcript_13350/g.11847  ORF Transcript_13350/g.11847 Transcript_13350/m.11847 type:complete len:184 (+) Transcript_13350:117-668(+)
MSEIESKRVNYDHEDQANLIRNISFFLTESQSSKIEPPEFNQNLEERDWKVLVENFYSYKGQWIKGTDIREGYGIQIHYDGSKYEGFFKNNHFEGHGNYITNENIYDGTFKKSKLHGEGIHVSQTGITYIGQFKKGLRQGIGKYSTVEGYFYDGEWANDLENGKGKLTIRDVSSYQGQFRKGK